MADRPEPDYTFLSDPDQRVIDRYGLLNAESERPIPHPTTFIVDRDGVVRWKFIEVDYTVRPSNRPHLCCSITRIHRFLGHGCGIGCEIWSQDPHPPTGPR